MSDQPQPSMESLIGLAELVAMRRIPDHHAMPLRLYVENNDAKMTVSQWDRTYKEMMSKPTGMSKAAWHEKFGKNS